MRTLPSYAQPNNGGEEGLAFGLGLAEAVLPTLQAESSATAPISSPAARNGINVPSPPIPAVLSRGHIGKIGSRVTTVMAPIRIVKRCWQAISGEITKSGFID
jgi:hypothetical protein